MKKGKLYLIPCTLGDSDIPLTIPAGITPLVNTINTYIVENERSTRRYLKKIGLKTEIDDLSLLLLNKYTEQQDLERHLNECEKGNDIGLISEAGCPGVADPGAEIVKRAHQKGIQVVPMVGPSSILLALMASGMNGQNFSFHGYLPIDRSERTSAFRKLESIGRSKDQAQIFIEAPYRNQKLLGDILQICENGTRLCIATDITLDTEFIRTDTIGNWKKNVPAINKRPTIFLIS